MNIKQIDISKFPADIYCYTDLKMYDIILYSIKWRDFESDIKSFYSILSDQEKTYTERFFKYDDKMRSIAARVIVKILLSKLLNILPENININKTEFGKPYVNNNKGINFSISHSGEYVSVAFSTRNIGIDIEKISDSCDYLNIAKNFFTKNESNIITAEGNINLFYQYWTAKEAFVKAIGEGLYRDLSTFDVTGDYIIENNHKWKVLKFIHNDYAMSLVYEN